MLLSAAPRSAGRSSSRAGRPRSAAARDVTRGEFRAAVTRTLGLALALAAAVAHIAPAAAAGEGMAEPASNDRIYVYQPLLAILLSAASGGYYAWRSDRALKARTARLDQEDEVRNLEVARLAGKLPPDSTAVDDALAEAERLREVEVRERELFAFGEATPTSLRTSWEVRLPRDEREVFMDGMPLTKIRRSGGVAGKEEGDEYVPPEWEDERAQIFIIVVGTPLLFWLLLTISTP